MQVSVKNQIHQVGSLETIKQELGNTQTCMEIIIKTESPTPASAFSIKQTQKPYQ